MPGTSVRAADFARRRATVAVRRSNHTSSSIAISDETIALMTASPITITTAVPKPSTVTPGSSSSTSSTRRASSTIAPMPRVSTEMGTTTIDRSGHTTPFTRPTTRPARRASPALSMSKPSSTAASTHSASAVVMTTTIARRRILVGVGRSSGARTNVSVPVMCVQLRSIGRAWAGSNRSLPGVSTRSRSAAPADVNSSVKRCTGVSSHVGRRTPTGE